MKRITDGERPSRPSRGEKLGLSNELWEVIQSSLAQEAEERCPVSRFIKFLEKATPDTAVLKALTEFDANNERHITKLRQMFGCGDNTLLGMREEETLTLIEVFDRVKLRSPPFRVSRTCLTRCGFRFSAPRWVTRNSVADVCTGFRKFLLDAASCRRATGSLTVPPPSPMILPRPRGGHPALASG